MQLSSSWKVAGSVSAAGIGVALVLLLATPAALAKKPANPGGGGGGGKAEGSASLELDTVECESTISAPVCSADDMSGSGTIFLTNSGGDPGVVSSVSLALESRQVSCDELAGCIPSFGPSGEDWELLKSAIVAASATCETLGEASTCHGVVTESAGAGLTISGALPTVNPTEECVGGVMVPFTYGFDVSSLGLAENDDLRLSLMVTFAPASGRSSCSLDADCDGNVDQGSGGDPVVNRTVQHRLRFPAPACN